MAASKHNGSFLPEIKEHFVGVDVVADRPEWAVDTDPAVEIVSGAGGEGGVVRITMDAGQTNIGGIIFGQLQWNPVDYGVYVEARVRLSAIGTADERVGVWLTDLQEDTLSEYPFTMTTTALTAAADPDDAVGIFWEGNGPDSFVFAGENTDSITANSIANPKALVAPVADTWHVVAFEVAPGGLNATAWADGQEIGSYKSTTPIVADTYFVPVFGATEGTTGINADIDYLIVRSVLDT